MNIADNEKTLSVNGVLSSIRESNKTNLNLELSEIDLSKFLANKDANAKNDSEPSSELEPNTETLIDWSWLKSAEGLNIDLSTPKVTLDQNVLEDLVLQLDLDNVISLKELSAKVDWGLSEELRFVDTLGLSGTITPLSSETMGPDVDVDIALKSPKFESTSKGEFNLNALSNQNFSLDLSMREFPIVESESTELFSGVLQQYLPIQLNSTLVESDEKITLNFSKSSFGETVVNVTLSAEDMEQDIPKFQIAFNADKLSFQSAEQSEDESDSSKEGAPINADSKLFSDNPIDWSFMQVANVDAQIHISEFLLNKLTIEDIVLTTRLNAGSPLNSDTGEQSPASRQLQISDISAKVADSQLSGSVEVSSIDDSAKVKLNLDIDSLALESLSIMPQEQLSGGNITVDTDLEMAGDSVAALASSTNGLFFVDLNDAIIQNDSFELIGSDLIFELISKLNPFAKNDPTTELKCATVYVPIENGIAKMDDSIALQTSKLVIVANGEINMDEEKLDLKFTPTSKSGIGVNVSSMVKFVKLGGSLAKPSPKFDAGGALASGLAAGAAISTGGTSLLATGLIDKTANNDVCGDARKLYANK